MSYMREETNVNTTGMVGLSATYVRCDKGVANYCSFKLDNLTETMCFQECLNLKYRYFGTMDELDFLVLFWLSINHFPKF
jgi:hypothetical protein